MQTFIFTLVFFLAFIALMAVGLFFKRKPITGSCGGIGGLKGVDRACDCKDPCAKAINERDNSKIM